MYDVYGKVVKGKEKEETETKKKTDPESATYYEACVYARSVFDI